MSRCCILDFFFFRCLKSLHLFLFQNSLWFFFFLTPSFKVLWYPWLYFFLLSYSISAVLWFFSLYFLLLSCPIGPCFYFFILARYLYTCWIATNEIKKILLITSNLYLKIISSALCWFPRFQPFVLNFAILHSMTSTMLFYPWAPHFHLIVP